MHSKRNTRIRKRVIAVFIIIIIILLLIMGGILLKGGKYIPAFFQLLFQKEIQLKTTGSNRINVLLLGTGGGVHDGPDLTDTMIFASIDPNSKKVTLVSIPRDLWMPELKAKLNTAYAIGEGKQEEGGLKLAKASISHLLGQEIDYAVRINFDGFVKAVDMVGGLDVAVDNTLDDYQYPIDGREDESCGHSDEKIASLSAELATGSATESVAFPCRYEHLRFEKGMQKMNGINALKFVRSRNSRGSEGSDFARSKRQEKVISAFKDKIFSVNTFLNPVKMVSLADVFSGSIDTDIKEDEYDDFVKLANSLKGAKTNSAVLDIGSEGEERYGLLRNPPITRQYKLQYVLIPRIGDGSYSELHKYVRCQIEKGDCVILQEGILAPTPKPEKSEKEK